MQRENVHKFRDGKLVLYTRGGATFHARLLIGGQYIFKSTKQVELFDARRVAEEWFEDYSYEHRHGRTISSKTFGSLMRIWLDEHRHGLSEHRYRYISGTCDRYLATFFGSVKLNEISNAMVAAYWPWRVAYWSSDAGKEKIQRAKKRRWSIQRPHHNTLDIVAKLPSQSSLQHEQAVLRQFFKWAKSRELVRETPIIEAPKRSGRKPTRRPSFDPSDWQKLLTFMDAWVAQEVGLNSYTFFHRALIKEYVRFLAGSGLRPGEARKLQWDDVEWFRDKDGIEHCIVHVRPDTKTGSRDVVCLRDAANAIFEMAWCNTPDKPRKYVFSNRDDVPVANLNLSFKTLLRKAGVLKDHFGMDRTTYSLRHFYASQQLMRGVPIDDLAQNMGSSIKMIVSHYSHLTTRMRAHIHGGSLLE